MSELCSTTENGVRCQELAESEFIVSCVHEHINRDLACPRHAVRPAELTAQGATWLCIYCDTGPGAHDCIAVLDGPRPLAGATSNA